MSRVFLLVSLICVALARAADQSSLGFYIVSEDARPGLRFIDSAALPKVGYVATKSDLAITQLEAVSVDTYHDRSRLIHKDGSVEQTNEDRPALDIRLTAADAKLLGQLTSAHLGSRLLFMAGNDPISAPMIRAPINTQDVQIALPAGTDAEKLKANLQTFVRKPQ